MDNVKIRCQRYGGEWRTRITYRPPNGEPLVWFFYCDTLAASAVRISEALSCIHKMQPHTTSEV